MNDLTIVDIARLAGVGVSSVSRVLNNHPDVSEKTRAKVLAVIQAHDYVPNNSARNLKRESAKAIAIIVKGFSNPLFTSMLSVIQTELEHNGYSSIIVQVDPNSDEVSTAISVSKEKKPRGIIFMGGNFSHSHDKLDMLGAPFVMLTITLQNDDVDPSTFSSVTIDDLAAGYTLANTLIGHGHKHLAILGFNPDDLSVSCLRIEGFRKALRENGLPAGDDIVEFAGASTFRAGYDGATALLDRTRFTCLFCVSDVLALGAMRALHDAGHRIPEGISLVGFDGIEEGRYTIPSLATMKQPERKMAKDSVRTLLTHIRSGAPHRHKIYQATFLSGESFAPRKK